MRSHGRVQRRSLHGQMTILARARLPTRLAQRSRACARLSPPAIALCVPRRAKHQLPAGLPRVVLALRPRALPPPLPSQPLAPCQRKLVAALALYNSASRTPSMSPVPVQMNPS